MGDFTVAFFSAMSAAFTAEAVTIPFDSLKVIAQVSPRGAPSPAQLIRSYGLPSLWAGYSAGCTRHFIFASLRLSLYEPIRAKVSHDPKAPTVLERVLAAVTAGGLAMSVGSAGDLIKVRAQSYRVKAIEAGLPPTIPPLRTLISEIYASGGIPAFWRGAGANIARNSIVNGAEVGTYDSVKQALLAAGVPESQLLYAACGSVSGLIATCVSSPVDVIKTRVMAGDRSASVAGIVKQLYGQEGLAGFYRGFKFNMARMVFFNIVMFLTYENVKKAITTHLKPASPSIE